MSDEDDGAGCQACIDGVPHISCEPYFDAGPPPPRAQQAAPPADRERLAIDDATAGSVFERYQRYLASRPGITAMRDAINEVLAFPAAPGAGDGWSQAEAVARGRQHDWMDQVAVTSEGHATIADEREAEARLIADAIHAAGVEARQQAREVPVTSPSGGESRTLAPPGGGETGGTSTRDGVTAVPESTGAVPGAPVDRERGLGLGLVEALEEIAGQDDWTTLVNGLNQPMCWLCESPSTHTSDCPIGIAKDALAAYRFTASPTPGTTHACVKCGFVFGVMQKKHLPGPIQCWMSCEDRGGWTYATPGTTKEGT